MLTNYTSYDVAYLFVCACVVPVDAVSGYVLSSVFHGGFASSYSGLGSFTCCSVMSLFCWWSIWIYKFSQLFIFRRKATG